MHCGCSRLRTFCNFGLKFPLSQLLETKLPLSSLQIMTAYLRGFIQNSYCILNSPPASIQAKAGARQASITTGQSKTGPPGLSELSPSSTLEMAKFCWHSACLESGPAVVPWLAKAEDTLANRYTNPSRKGIQIYIQISSHFALKISLHQYGIRSVTRFKLAFAGIRDTYLVITQIAFVWKRHLLWTDCWKIQSLFASTDPKKRPIEILPKACSKHTYTFFRAVGIPMSFPSMATNNDTACILITEEWDTRMTCTVSWDFGPCEHKIKK